MVDTGYFVSAHKDADGQSSAVLHGLATGERHDILCPAEFGGMSVDTRFMFDMNPWWQRAWHDLDPRNMAALKALTCYDHHIGSSSPGRPEGDAVAAATEGHPRTDLASPDLHYKLISFDVPTAAGILSRYWSDLDRDMWWIGCVGAAGDLFTNWRSAIPSDKLNLILKHYPEFSSGRWLYPRSGIRADVASYCSTLLNAEYRVNFFRGASEGAGFWQPTYGVEGMRQCGDPTTFAYSTWGDNLFAMKDIIRRASDHAVSAGIGNVTGYKMNDEEKEFGGHTVESRHTFMIDCFAVLIFKSVLDIGSFASVKLHDVTRVTSIVLNKYPVCGKMHCSIRGPQTLFVLKELARAGYPGGGHPEAGGALIPHGDEHINNFIQAIRHIKLNWGSQNAPVTGVLRSG